MSEDTTNGSTELKAVEATEKDGKKVNVEMAAIAYVLFLIPLLTDAKDDPFVKFHLKQAIMLVIVAVVSSVISSVIPFIGWFILGPVTTIFCLVLWIMGIMNALNKQKKELPLIGKYAEQYLKF